MGFGSFFLNMSELIFRIAKYVSIGWGEFLDPETVEKYRVYLNEELVKEITDPYTTSYTYSRLLPETLYRLKVDYVYSDGTSETATAEIMTSAPPAGKLVVFTDDNLKNAISNQLKIQHRDIYSDDMEKLTYLDASYSDISDLTGLEFAVNLTELMVYGNQIEDLSPIENLTNLESLDLDENLVISLDDLKKLQKLERLFLSFNQIEDIQVLNELHNLTYVTLIGNEGLDFTKGSNDADVIKNLILSGVSVEWMVDNSEIFIQEVSESSIEFEFRLPGVSDFISAYNLYLNGELVAEIPVKENSYKVTGLRPLTEYDISIEAVDEAGNVWGSAYNYVMTPPLPKGEVIHFKDQALEDAVRDSLYIYSRNLYESDMAILTSLDASNRGIEELDGIELAVNLESLMLDNNEIVDISILSQLSKLTILSLQGNKVKNIGALADLPIEFLNIGFNEIDDISSLLELENLQYVLIMNNPVDLTEGSETRSMIQTLEDNGVMVTYEFLDIQFKEIMENSVTISWLPVPKNDIQDYFYYVLVDGEEIAADLTDSSFTLTDLEGDTEYRIEVLGISEVSESFIYGTNVVTTAAVKDKPVSNPGESEDPGEGTEVDGAQTPMNPSVETEESSTSVDKVTQKAGQSMPNTATDIFNLLLFGFGLVCAGVFFYAVKARKIGNRQ